MAQVVDFANNAKPSIPPEMALNEPDIVYSVRRSALWMEWYGVSSYNVAPMAKGRPRNTGIDWVSFL